MSHPDPVRLTELLQAARSAQKKAVAPYSNFRVGAALQTTSGAIYTGCNIEVSSYSLTICAERVALFKALSEGVSDFKTLVVFTETDDFCPPCGACRQVLIDYAPGLSVVLLNAQGETKTTDLAHLLPDAFTPKFLKR